MRHRLPASVSLLAALVGRANTFGHPDRQHAASPAGALSICLSHSDFPRQRETVEDAVGPVAHSGFMQTHKVLRGIELRYVLAIALINGGTMTVADLSMELTRQRFTVGGRPSKAISDALRWEVLHGRVVRTGHGAYSPGYMPRSTEYRIRRRVADLVEAAALPYDDSPDRAEDAFWASFG